MKALLLLWGKLSDWLFALSNFLGRFNSHPFKERPPQKRSDTPNSRFNIKPVKCKFQIVLSTKPQIIRGDDIFYNAPALIASVLSECKYDLIITFATKGRHGAGRKWKKRTRCHFRIFIRILAHVHYTVSIVLAAASNNGALMKIIIIIFYTRSFQNNTFHRREKVARAKISLLFKQTKMAPMYYSWNNGVNRYRERLRWKSALFTCLGQL